MVSNRSTERDLLAIAKFLVMHVCTSRPSVRSFVHYQNFEHDILKTNESILL